MPIITVQAIKGVVLVSDEQKRELLQKMTDAFISVVGEVARPYTYCLIQETPLYEWSVGGHPLPDLQWLYGPDYVGMHAKANEIMKGYVDAGMAPPPPPGSSTAPAAAEAPAPAASDPDPAGGHDEWSQRAQSIWGGST